jgi:hypothetical protein
MTTSEKNREELSKHPAPVRDELRRKSAHYAEAFWKQLVKNVGEREAKEIMRVVIGDKKPGPRVKDEDLALIGVIYAYILRWGPDQTDGKIANRLFESNPHYIIFESGTIAIANDEITESYLSSSDDPIVSRRPFDMHLHAIKKRVERFRRWAIEEEMLSEAYAPRPYYRD